MSKLPAQSLADRVREWSPAKRKRWFSRLSLREQYALRWQWRDFWARSQQLAPPGDWFCWLILAGRGFGKTRAGAEFIIESVRNGARRIALVGATAADVRDVMIEGESGIIACSPPGFVPHYEPSKRRLTWPNGAISTAYSADVPARLRGPQHDTFWADELAAWRYHEAWDMLRFGMRLGKRPRGVVTTTPRPIKALRELVNEDTTIITRGSTRDNIRNLAPVFLSTVVRKYEGTTLGRQELDAELLDETPGALWRRQLFEANRVAQAPTLRRIVVALDPSTTADEKSDEAGIVVAGREGNEYFVLEDKSAVMSPGAWASRVVDLFHEHQADRIIYESNQGGDMVKLAIQTVWKQAPLRAVHAKRSKVVRAEPVVALYEQGHVHHVGLFPELEDQCCSWSPLITDESPDRMDALVYAITDLMTGGHYAAANANQAHGTKHRAA